MNDVQREFLNMEKPAPLDPGPDAMAKLILDDDHTPTFAGVVNYLKARSLEAAMKGDVAEVFEYAFVHITVLEALLVNIENRKPAPKPIEQILADSILENGGKEELVPMAVVKAIVKKFPSAPWILGGQVDGLALKFYGDHYGFWYQSIFYGVEFDGYIHT